MPEDVINDATAYGVAIAPVEAPEGATYWRVLRVHHLTPAENHGNHHIYLDALDETGQRIQGAQALVTWEGGRQTLTIDKPAGEPGANCPMWKYQVCAVEMLGLPSDRVTNLHTGHVDEPPGTGNTLFHHSFHVDFKRTVKEAVRPATQSAISGRVVNGAGRGLLLLQDETTLASTLVAADEAYRFADLGAGSYVVAVEGAEVRSQLVALAGTNSAPVELELQAEPSGKVIERYVLFGLPQSPRAAVHLALAEELLVKTRPTFGFRPEDAALAQEVLLIGSLEDIGQEIEEALAAGGAQVRRIQGSAQEIAAQLKPLAGGHAIFLPTEQQ